MTFSIIGRDARTGALGIAVQSKVIAVGAIVPWATSTAGALVNQSLGGPSFGPRALSLLEAGERPSDVVRSLLEADALADVRQLGVVSKSGEAFSYTGSRCRGWAGAIDGPGYCCIGNSLAGRQVVEEMQAAFLASSGELARRLLSALKAGQAAGGDVRGMQSAALLVVREGWGYSGAPGRYVDLRVDEHSNPIAELRRIYEMHRVVMQRWLETLRGRA